jgi:hypothetical protein
MASTRNLNTLSNYRLETSKNQKGLNYNVNPDDIIKVAYAGNGLIQGKMLQNSLSHNSVDIESYLFGIRSTDVTKEEKETFYPQSKDIKFRNIIHDTPKVIMPHPLDVDRSQRPLIN